LEWLDKLTFPTEAKFSDEAYAREEYRKLVQATLAGGTTTCCYYSSIHLGASKVLADLAIEFGQRVFVGKCNMDRQETCPSYYVESSAEISLQETRLFIDHCRRLDPTGEKVCPIVTPRFALGCTKELLDSLGQLAREEGLPIQTHVSENVQEIEQTKALYGSNYVEVYQSSGLLTDRTILAHAVHLTADEIKCVRQADSGLAHCPSSNFNLGSGICPVRHLLQSGLRVGLGTDLSAGHNVSILEEMKCARQASMVIGMGVGGGMPKGTPTDPTAQTVLSLENLFYMATLGGASLCRLDHLIGSFTLGKAFDAVQVTLEDTPHHQPGDRLERFLSTGHPCQIIHVWIGGRRRYSKGAASV